MLTSWIPTGKNSLRRSWKQGISLCLFWISCEKTSPIGFVSNANSRVEDLAFLIDVVQSLNWYNFKHNSKRFDCEDMNDSDRTKASVVFCAFFCSVHISGINASWQFWVVPKRNSAYHVASNIYSQSCIWSNFWQKLYLLTFSCLLLIKLCFPQ